jgi:signal transduction histidine kinase
MRAIGLLVACVAVTVSFGAMAEPPRATPAQAQALVKKAIAHYKKVGKDKSMADFSKADGSFVDRELYVVVIRMDGLEIAHINPRSVGKNVLELRDADGKYLIKDRMEAAKSGATGWQDYRFYNPLTKTIEDKRTYWERADDLVFSSGAYKPN